ncbi:hypothetical protein ACOL3G_05460 [Aliarcobacter butzleri]
MKKNQLIEKIKKIPIAIILSSLLSGGGAGWIIYSQTKEDNRKSWCRQEIKSLDINSYRDKDLSIMYKECKEEIKEFELFEDILFNSNDINKFSSFINQMYVNDKIDEKTIIDFSNKALFKKIRNEKYNFDNNLVNTQNNLPPLDPQITKYLQFTKEILFKSHEDIQEQLSNYFEIFIILFKKENLFPYYSIPSYNDVLKNNYEFNDIEENKKLLDLQKILRNFGKENKQKIIINSKDEFIIALTELFNSYKERDSKIILINRLSFLVKLLEKNENIDKSLITNENQWQYINEKFYAEKIIQLILSELYNYKLEDSELKLIFNEYINLNKYLDKFMINTVDKLTHKLFTENFSVSSLNNEELFRQLFFDNYKDKKITLNSDFINYLGIEKQINLLMDITKLDNDKKEIKLEIFHALMLSQAYHKNSSMNRVDPVLLIDIIKNEQNEELQRLLLRDSLELDSIEIVEFAINYINTNKEYYLKELNENPYLSNDFYFMSVFRYLSDNKIFWISKQKEINKKKFDLFINFMTQTINEENKLKLFDCVLQTIEKNDISLIEQLKLIISDEKNPILKERMINKFTTFNKNSSNS